MALLSEFLPDIVFPDFLQCVVLDIPHNGFMGIFDAIAGVDFPGGQDQGEIVGFRTGWYPVWEIGAFRKFLLAHRVIGKHGLCLLQRFSSDLS